MGNEDGSQNLSLRFWGVRGSIPTPVAENLGFGGNTACIELRSDRRIVAIDAGTGARSLGVALDREFQDRALRLSLLLTHFHWDHIQGFPYFAPLYRPSNDISIYAGRPAEEIRALLTGQMAHPYFPVQFDLVSSVSQFVELPPSGLDLADVAVRPFPLQHPQGATGFRIEWNGRVVVHAFDTEHGNPLLDRTIREYAENADILIYDAQFTPYEYQTKRGWGHSTWEQGVRIARECNVKRLMLFHHDPGHDDSCLMDIERQARSQFENTDAAREGSEIRL
jgi:phosphoribosyl 1,2-cyclic phosphodiesterase